MIDVSSIRRTLNRLAEWLSQRLSSSPGVSAATASISKSHRYRLVVFCAAIFFIALGVRWLHWQDDAATTGASLSSLANRYQTQAEGILEDGGLFFPTGESETVGIQRLVHPPGYPLFIAVVYKV